MKNFFHTVLAASALALLPACINIQYDGISAEPLSESEPVGLYFSADQIPVKTYDVLGEATATAGEAYSATEVEAKLRSFARVHGANAVLIVDIKRTVAGKARRRKSAGALCFVLFLCHSIGRRSNFALMRIS